MTELDTIKIHRRGGAATIELARPETMNAWNKQFGLDLLAAVEEVRDDEAVRAICITGAGRGFSSGADLKDMSGRDELTEQGRPDVYKVLTERYHPIITGLRTMPKPVVAAVNGPAVGIGLSLALAADLVVARESAYFLLAFVNIGLAPDGGSSLFVPERVGFTRAIEMAMLGERVPAPQAAEWGLDQQGVRRRRVRRRGRPRSSTASPPARPPPTRASSASSTRGCMPGWTASWSWKPRCSVRWRTPTTSSRACQRSCRSAPPRSPGAIRVSVSEAPRRRALTIRQAARTRTVPN